MHSASFQDSSFNQIKQAPTYSYLASSSFPSHGLALVCRVRFSSSTPFRDFDQSLRSHSLRASSLHSFVSGSSVLHTALPVRLILRFRRSSAISFCQLLPCLFYYSFPSELDIESGLSSRERVHSFYLHLFSGSRSLSVNFGGNADAPDRLTLTGEVCQRAVEAASKAPNDRTLLDVFFLKQMESQWKQWYFLRFFCSKKSPWTCPHLEGTIHFGHFFSRSAIQTATASTFTRENT